MDKRYKMLVQERADLMKELNQIHGSAERGTSGRRPQRQPRATLRTSSTPSRTRLFPAPTPITPSRRRSGAAGCAGR